MQTIYKFRLEITDQQTLLVPGGYKFLSAGMQDLHLCVWVVVDPSVKEEAVEVLIVGTGHPMPNVMCEFVGTVQDHRGLVWHVFVRSMHTLLG